MKNIQPTLDFVYVKEAKDKTLEEKKGSIYIPQNVQKEKLYHEVEVLAVGPGTYQNGVLVKPNVDVGDRVIFMLGSARARVDEDDEFIYWVLKCYDLMGKVGKDA